jgi:Flp pilus assembly protein TadG
MNPLKRLMRGNRGSAMIEVAVSMLVAVPLLMWAFEFAMCCYTASVLQYAAREGVQFAIAHGSESSNGSGPGTSDPGGTNVQAVVKQIANSASLHNMTGLTVTTSWESDAATPGSPVSVKVSWQYDPYIRLPWIEPTIKGTASAVVNY